MGSIVDALWRSRRLCLVASNLFVRRQTHHADRCLARVRYRSIGEALLDGATARRLAALIPPDHVAVIHLAITDEHPLAQAFVVIEAVPRAMA